MRVALLSDVHANRVALDAVLGALPKVDEIWVMGDTVGYGPDPSDVIARLRERGAHLVAGNHDRAVATGDGLELFNEVAAEAAEMHRSWLAPDEIAWLAALPLVLERSEITMFHGSLRSPLWEYIFDELGAAPTLERAKTACSVCGHTHVPALFERDGGEVTSRPIRLGQAYPIGGGRTASNGGRTASNGGLASNARTLVNPGSVGQPRDRDPRASWAILDTESGVSFHRVAYNVAETQKRMRARKLPAFLVDRLAVGI